MRQRAFWPPRVSWPAASLPQAAHFVDHLGAALLAAIMVLLGMLAVRANLHRVSAGFHATMLAWGTGAL